ncbi:MAG: efflux RND transporter permease subunit [Myxococcota bacterium]
MSDVLDRLNALFAGLPARLRARRGRVAIVSLLLTGALSYGAAWLEVDMAMESFFVEDDPVLTFHQAFERTFGSDDNVYIVYEAKDGDVFSPRSLAAVRRIQNRLLSPPAPDAEGNPSALERVIDVQTIVNAGYLEVRDDTLVSRDFVEALPGSRQEIDALRARAMDHEEFPGFYVSEDSRYGGIWIRTDLGMPEDFGADTSDDFGGADLDPALAAALADGEAGSPPVATDMVEYAIFSRALVEVLDDPVVHEALTLYPVGNPVLMGFFNDVLGIEIAFFTLGAMAIMAVVLGVLFRSLAGVVWPLAIITLSSSVTFGLAGWLDLTMSLMVSLLSILILVVGIADSVHILSGYVFFRGQGAAHEDAMAQVYGRSALACLLTSVTTALGMLALLIVPIPPIRAFGIASALGVMVAFAFTIFVLPLLLDLWAPPPRSSRGASHPRLQALLAGAGDLGERRPVAIVAVFAVVGATGLVGLTRVAVDSNLVSIIREGLPIRVAHDLVDRVMGGTQGMEIYVEFGEPEAMQDPLVLQTLDATQKQIERDYPDFVVRTSSLTLAAKRSYRVLNEDRPDFYTIPDDPNALAQTLLLFDMAAPEDREVVVPDDYSAGRISVRLLNYGSMVYVDFFASIQADVEAAFAPLRDRYPDMRLGIAGSLPLLMRMADSISRSQIQSFTLVLIVVTTLLLVVFGSIRVGLVSMIPNVYPVVITFGVMGLFRIPLDADTLLIAPMLIGIAVDDTIHFVTHYRAFLQEHGGQRAAIRATLEEVGQAIAFTSLILILGFLILLGSNHTGLAHFGLLIGIAFGTAFLADIFLLPALLKLTGADFGRERPAPAG